MVQKLLIALAVCGWLPQERSGMGGGVLDHAKLARQAVGAHNQANAPDHLSRAWTSGQNIRTRVAAQGQPLLVLGDVEGTGTTGKLDVADATGNLEVAKAALMSHNDAVAPLRTAAQALRDDTSLSSSHAEAAQSMGGQVRNYAGEIRRDRTDASARVDGWLGPIGQWRNSKS